MEAKIRALLDDLAAQIDDLKEANERLLEDAKRIDLERQAAEKERDRLKEELHRIRCSLWWYEASGDDPNGVFLKQPLELSKRPRRTAKDASEDAK